MEILTKTAELLANVLNTAYHKFSPQGWVGTLFLYEGHICIHAFPESGHMIVDILIYSPNSLSKVCRHLERGQTGKHVLKWFRNSKNFPDLSKRTKYTQK